jgi:hypothetical protein
LAKKINPSLSDEVVTNSEQYLDNVPDIQSRYVINNTVKKFLEIFAS